MNLHIFTFVIKEFDFVNLFLIDYLNERLKSRLVSPDNTVATIYLIINTCKSTVDGWEFQHIQLPSSNLLV